MSGAAKFRFQKTLFYFRRASVPFFHETDRSWLDRFVTAARAVDSRVEPSVENPRPELFCLSLGFPDLDSEAAFSREFYLKGTLKDLFKESMRYSKTAQIGFSMSNINLDRLDDNAADFTGVRVVSCDVKPNAETRFFDTTAEKKATIPLLNEILRVPETLSCSAFYDFEDQVKHLQTVYTRFDDETRARVAALLERFPGQTSLRNEYNDAHGIRCIRVRETRTLNLNRHYLGEIGQGAPEWMRAGLEAPLFKAVAK